MNYFVAKYGNDKNSGDEKSPFFTIQKAADTAFPGDTITVCEGIYREWVKPARGGKNDKTRITYKAKEGHKVVIKGSEEINNWEKDDSLWIAKIPNYFFGETNPFNTMLEGDWLDRMYGEPFLHTGAVYSDGKMLSEKLSKNEIGKMCWFAEVDNEFTTIYADFDSKNPNETLTEINVRPSCFAPKTSRLDYITLSGFELCHAATNWAPPTGEQNGAVWARWCKGWIIENNIIHHSRCSGISLGRDGSLGNNVTTTLKQKPGFSNQLEIVFKSLNADWSKENIGSHIVRNNHIFECGQTGIVGHMGGAFSEIYGNHIHHICKKEEFIGFEIAGIKLHAALDTYIHHNCIHDCRRGLWLDWQAQGVRVSSNLFFNNLGLEDVYAEVTHGPLLIDNNIFNSPKSFLNHAQGTAFINNWFGGEYLHGSTNDLRYTPYHLPHSTMVAGCSLIHQDDDRVYNNIFATSGTTYYNGKPTSYEEFWEKATEGIKKMCIDTGNFHENNQPVYINSNVYSAENQAFDKEESKHIDSSLKLEIFEEKDGFYVQISMDKPSLNCKIINSHDLPVPRITECLYETPLGENIIIDTDITGKKYAESPIPGPVQTINKKVKVF